MNRQLLVSIFSELNTGKMVDALKYAGADLAGIPGIDPAYDMPTHAGQDPSNQIVPWNKIKIPMPPDTRPQLLNKERIFVDAQARMNPNRTEPSILPFMGDSGQKAGQDRWFVQQSTKGL